MNCSNTNAAQTHASKASRKIYKLIVSLSTAIWGVPWMAIKRYPWRRSGTKSAGSKWPNETQSTHWKEEHWVMPSTWECRRTTKPTTNLDRTIHFREDTRLCNKAKRTYVIMLIAILICRWQQSRSDSYLHDFYAFTELKKTPFVVSI